MKDKKWSRFDDIKVIIYSLYGSEKIHYLSDEQLTFEHPDPERLVSFHEAIKLKLVPHKGPAL